ncbi:MAG TPA: Ada metal-binding domain-containing protein, partial [Phototrophicaceae bacterium]|nr:Ada metal-binding domain-containing protein [Phototrophicaceae bacterium]
MTELTSTRPFTAEIASPEAEEYWQAVQTKDRAYEGEFVFAVQSTGIYCRPTCNSRLPKRENVAFFPTPQEAAKAGFRACKRCQPDETDARVSLIQEICDYIQQSEAAPTLADLSERFHISRFHLQRTFKRVTGVSPRQYYDAHRVEQFKSQLKEGTPVTQALYDAGFSSVSQLYPGQLGMTPTEYQRGGAGQRIRYSIFPCYLGLLMVAATERGICAVRISNSEDDLRQQLLNEFPAADLKQDHDEVSVWIDAILGYLDRQPTALDDLPLDIQA